MIHNIVQSKSGFFAPLDALQKGQKKTIGKKTRCAKRIRQKNGGKNPDKAKMPRGKRKTTREN